MIISVIICLLVLSTHSLYSRPAMSITGASATAHPIVLDDTDPSIRYTANQWFPHDVNQLNVLGNTGPIWNGTTTSTSVDGATLSFSFSGAYCATVFVDLAGATRHNDF
jgi:hypothetical protein